MDLKEVEEGASSTAPTPVVQQQAEVLHFDSKPLNGLRGLAALHILIFHSLWYTEHRIHIYGNVRFCFSENIIFLRLYFSGSNAPVLSLIGIFPGFGLR